MNEFVEEGIFKIVFVKSADNDRDILTKNLGGDLHWKHWINMIGEKLK